MSHLVNIKANRVPEKKFKYSGKSISVKQRAKYNKIILDHELKVRQDKAYTRKNGTRRSIDTLEMRKNEAVVQSTEDSIMLNCEPGVVMTPIRITQTNNSEEEQISDVYDGFQTYRTCSIKKENLIENGPGAKAQKHNYSNYASPRPE